jgi:DNA-binding transcriptional LysR family regulator
MAVAASPYHPLAGHTTIKPDDLNGLDFIGFDEDLPIRKNIDRFLREHHVHVNVTLHFDNIQMIKEVVAHGTGVSIMPARVMEEEVAQGRLVPIPIAGFELFRPVGIVHRRKKRFQRAAQALLDLLQAPASFSPSLYAGTLPSKPQFSRVPGLESDTPPRLPPR